MPLLSLPQLKPFINSHTSLCNQGRTWVTENTKKWCKTAQTQSVFLSNKPILKVNMVKGKPAFCRRSPRMGSLRQALHWKKYLGTWLRSLWFFPPPPSRAFLRGGGRRHNTYFSPEWSTFLVFEKQKDLDGLFNPACNSPANNDIAFLWGEGSKITYTVNCPPNHLAT